MRSYRFPNRKQAFAALAKAPLIPATVLFVWDATSRWIQLGPLAIVGAAMLSLYILIAMELVSLIVGGLILEMLWRRTSFNIVLTSLLGGAIAIIPVMCLVFLPSGNYNAWVDGNPTVINGQKTSFGHWQDIKMIGTVFAFGWVGGAAFWWFGKPKPGAVSVVDNDR